MNVLKTPASGGSGGGTNASYEFGPFRLDCGTRRLCRGDHVVALTPKAFDLLHVLLASQGRAVEKGELMKRVWPDSFVGEDNLTQNIATLRKALGDTADRPQYIATVSRHGYRFAADVRVLPERADAPEERNTPAGPEVQIPRRASGVATAWIAVGIVAILAVGVRIAVYRAAPSPTVLRFVVSPPSGTTFGASASFLAVSPNGRLLAFLASRPGEETRLWIRALDSLTARELTGTDGALGPFWSPDSRYVGFFAKGTLQKVSLLGEPPAVLCPTPSLSVASATWHSNGTILFSQPQGIYRVSAAGGVATQVTSVDRARGESAQVLPLFLPDGRHFVYTVRSDTGRSFDSWIVSRSLDSGDERRLFIAGSQALYAEPDYLLFLRGGTLLAQQFDVARQQLKGEPQPVPGAEHVGFNPASPRGMFSVSQTGVLAYRTSSVAELGWFDRSGVPYGWIGAAGFDYDPALSHDSQHLTVSRYDPATASRTLWMLDLARGGVASRFTAGSAWESCPVWSPHDTSIIYARGAPNDGELYQKNLVPPSEERALPHHLKGCPLDWSPDGQSVLYETTRGASGTLWVAPVTGDAEPKALAGTWPSGLRGPDARLSPDGRWLTYVSDVTGRREIYVRSFPDGSKGTWQVSSHGGIEPQWGTGGRQLFFLGADQKLMVAPVITEGTFRSGTPTALFSTELDAAGLPVAGRNQYLVTSDGGRFLINQPRPDAGSPPVTVLVNWRAALNK